MLVLLLIAVLLFIVGFVGSAKALADKKSTPHLKCPQSELEMRDKQYLFVSATMLLGSIGLLYVNHSHSHSHSN